MLRVIRELRPRCVVGENVPGIIKIAAGQVVKDLERAGYHVVVLCFEAAAVGAWHRRARVFFVAYADGARSCEGTDEKHTANGEFATQFRPSASSKALADAEGERGQGCPAIRPAVQAEGTGEMQSDAGGSNGSDACNTVRAGLPDRAAETVRKQGPREQPQRSDWWAAEPDMGRVAHGIPARVDRLKCLGNAVVPQQAYPIFRALRKELEHEGGKA